MQYFISFFLDFVSCLIFLGSFLFWISKDNRKIIKILCLYYSISGTLMLGAIFFYKFGLNSNLQFYTWLSLTSAIGIGLYFTSILQAQWKKYLAYLTIAINSFYYIMTNIGDPPAVFDSLGFVILSASVVILIFIFLHQLLTNIKEEPLSLNFDFWYVSSLLVYYLSAFAIFLTYGYLTKKAMDGNPEFQYSIALTWLWGIHNVLLFLSSLITMGSVIWISYHRKSSSS